MKGDWERAVALTSDPYEEALFKVGSGNVEATVEAIRALDELGATPAEACRAVPPAQPDGEMVCPDCGGPASVVDRFVFYGSSGPVLYLILRGER